MTSQGPVCSFVSLRSEVHLHIFCLAPRVSLCRRFTLQTINTTLQAVMLPRRSQSVCLSAELSLGISASIMRFPSSCRFFVFVCILHRLWGPTNLILNWFCVFLLLRVKRPMREAEHSPLSTVRDWWSHLFIFLYALMPCINWFCAFLLLRVKRPKREAEHSPLSTVRDWWSHIFIFLYALMPCINWFCAFLLLRVKRQKRKAEHSPLSTVRYCWSHIFIFLYALMPCINWFCAFLLLRVKRPKREAEHSPLSTVRDWWSYIYFFLYALMPCINSFCVQKKCPTAHYGERTSDPDNSRDMW
jgi:integrase